MKEVTVFDRFSDLTIRMCEKHFKAYRGRLDRAMEGGTNYSFKQTRKRGCDICKKERS